MNPKPRGARDPYWDCLKMVLIFLVVFGHTLKFHVVAGSTGQGVYNFIYLFHMPLFIFISGRFSQCRDRRRYLRGMFRLIETYAVFQVLMCLLNSYVVAHVPFTLHRLLFEPMWAMWYLLALFCWRLFIFLLPQKWLNGRPVMVMALSVAVGLGEGFLPFDPYFTLHHTLSSLPFFMGASYVLFFLVSFAASAAAASLTRSRRESSSLVSHRPRVQVLVSAVM